MRAKLLQCYERSNIVHAAGNGPNTATGAFLPHEPCAAALTTWADRISAAVVLWCIRTPLAIPKISIKRISLYCSTPSIIVGTQIGTIASAK
ncbi:hypothetical protein ACRAWG_06290 [Methylobacterium sp. P31]